MKAITDEQLEQVIDALDLTLFSGMNHRGKVTRALTTLRELPELKFHYIKDHPAGFTSTQQRHVWEKQMEKMDTSSQGILDSSKQEPVAEVIDDGTPEGSIKWIPMQHRIDGLQTGELLYAHPAPVRELSDEEIEEIVYNNDWADPNQPQIIVQWNELGHFARAILQAAREK